jgi:hypothetical protein
MHLLITLIWSLYNVHMSWINAFYPTNIHYSYVSVKIKVIDCTKRRSLANHQQQYSSCPQRRIMGYPIHNWKSGMSKSGQPDRTLRTTDLRKTPKLCKSWGDIHYPHQQGRNTDFLFFSIFFYIFLFPNCIVFHYNSLSCIIMPSPYEFPLLFSIFLNLSSCSNHLLFLAVMGI